MKHETSKPQNQRATNTHRIRESIPWPGIHGVPRDAKKSARKLGWFPLRANPAASWNEATKSGRTRDKARSDAGARLNQTVIVQRCGATETENLETIPAGG